MKQWELKVSCPTIKEMFTVSISAPKQLSPVVLEILGNFITSGVQQAGTLLNLELNNGKEETHDGKD